MLAFAMILGLWIAAELALVAVDNVRVLRRLREAERAIHARTMRLTNRRREVRS